MRKYLREDFLISAGIREVGQRPDEGEVIQEGSCKQPPYALKKLCRQLKKWPFITMDFTNFPTYF